jgi:hypothetical protein
MTTTAIIALVLLGTAVGAVVGYVIGRDHGIEYGRASQWVDDYFGRIAAERARHGKDGKFIGRVTT